MAIVKGGNFSNGAKPPLANEYHNCNFSYSEPLTDTDSNIKWTDEAQNGVTTEGLNHILDVEFHGETQVTTWYIGLIRDDSYSALAAGDTLASHAGWQEGDEYTGDRKEWTEGAASAGSMTNASTVDFAINDTETMKGAFLCSAATGTSGKLYCTALFTGGDRAVISGGFVIRLRQAAFDRLRRRLWAQQTAKAVC